MVIEALVGAHADQETTACHHGGGEAGGGGGGGLGGVPPLPPDFPFPPFPLFFFALSSASVCLAFSHNFTEASRNMIHPPPSFALCQTLTANRSCAPPGWKESMYSVIGFIAEVKRSETQSNICSGNGATGNCVDWL